MTLLAPIYLVEPAPYILDLPAAKWLTSNQRGNWRRHAPTIAVWRELAAWAVKAERVPALGRVYVIAEVRGVDLRRRDPGNWYPSAKAAVDGLVDAGVLADDDAGHLIGPDMRLGEPCRPPRLLLHIWPLVGAP